MIDTALQDLISLLIRYLCDLSQHWKGAVYISLTLNLFQLIRPCYLREQIRKY